MSAKPDLRALQERDAIDRKLEAVADAIDRTRHDGKSLLLTRDVLERELKPLLLEGVKMADILRADTDCNWQEGWDKLLAQTGERNGS